MKQHQASRTAEYMALFRALESLRPADKRLFEDRFAFAFLQPDLQRVARWARLPLLGGIIPWLIDLRWPGARTSGVARTKLIDGVLERTLPAGIEQVVILGAGYDCRAYRMAEMKKCRVFEVDHPNTQQAKQKRLRQLVETMPSSVIYVACDFNRQSLAETLHAASLDLHRRTFFLWEGVTNYLTAEAVDTTLRFIRQAAPGSRLLFTYVHQGALDGAAEFGSHASLQQILEQAGETWTFGLNPAELRDYLAARGLALVEDIGSVEYRRRYLPPSARNLKGYEFYRAALAEVRSDIPR